MVCEFTSMSIYKQKRKFHRISIRVLYVGLLVKDGIPNACEEVEETVHALEHAVKVNLHLNLLDGPLMGRKAGCVQFELASFTVYF